MSEPREKSTCEKEGDCGNKKEKKNELKTVKTTTEISTTFFLTKFNEREGYLEEKLPKNFKDLDELLNKILFSLEETENVFINQAKAIQCVDLTLINWRLRLKKVQTCLEENKRDFERLDQTLECLSKLNCHIEKIVKKLEKELPGSSLVENAFKYCPTRMNMYKSMLDLNSNQREMSQQILSILLTINEAIESNPSDPVGQLTRILSLHMEVLRDMERRMVVTEEQLKAVKTLLEFYTNIKKPLIPDCYYYYCCF